MAECLKAAEEVSQEDACPIVGREQLRPILLALRERTPELRARQTQTGTAVFSAIKKKIYRYFFEEEKELDMEYYI